MARSRVFSHWGFILLDLVSQWPRPAKQKRVKKQRLENRQEIVLVLGVMGNENSGKQEKKQHKTHHLIFPRSVVKILTVIIFYPTVPKLKTMLSGENRSPASTMTAFPCCHRAVTSFYDPVLCSLLCLIPDNIIYV